METVYRIVRVQNEEELLDLIESTEVKISEIKKKRRYSNVTNLIQLIAIGFLLLGLGLTLNLGTPNIDRSIFIEELAGEVVEVPEGLEVQKVANKEFTRVNGHLVLITGVENSKLMGQYVTYRQAETYNYLAKDIIFGLNSLQSALVVLFPISLIAFVIVGFRKSENEFNAKDWKTLNYLEQELFQYKNKYVDFAEEPDEPRIFRLSYLIPAEPQGYHY